MNPGNIVENAIVLPPKLNIRNILSVYDSLLDFDPTGESVFIDIPLEADADLSFVQLIEAARLSSNTSGRAVVLRRPATGTLLDVLKRGGFVESFSAEDRKFWLHEEVTQ